MFSAGEATTSFQSPPHRGDRCNFTFVLVGVESQSAWVSVPSSSGRSVQRRENHATHRRLASFSPLLIGEIGATMPGLATPQMLIWLVSVPSSSGRSVQL